MNRLELSVRQERQRQGGPLCLYLGVAIDGEWWTNLHLPVIGDLWQFALSLDRDGAYRFFICTCGEAGCAGWLEDIAVHRDESRVHWQYPRLRNTPVTLAFPLRDYRRQIKHAMTSAILAMRAWQGDAGDVLLAPHPAGDVWLDRYRATSMNP